MGVHTKTCPNPYSSFFFWSFSLHDACVLRKMWNIYAALLGIWSKFLSQGTVFNAADFEVVLEEF